MTDRDENDGMREGGAVFSIVVICGIIAASFVDPRALTSFWVWLGLLSMATGVAVSVRRMIAGSERAS